MTKEHKEFLIDYHSKEYVVVDTLNNKIYFVSNLTDWCRNNFPELVKIKEGKDFHRLGGVLQQTSALYKNRWWACRKENWTGKVVLKETARAKGNGIKKYPFKVIDEEDNIYEGTNRAEFCRKHKLDPSSFNKMLKGKYKSYKGFKVYN